MSDFADKRIVGLDVVRAAAILMVLVSHARQALVTPDDHLALTFGGWYGVELFFALSGFLIGTILYKLFLQGITTRGLGRFWFRRWMRTLPAYFIILLFVAWYQGLFDWSYFVLLQWPMTHSFKVLPVSWSLAIEEWFYLIFPVIALALHSMSKRHGFLAAIIIIVCVPTLYRCYQYAVSAPAIDIRVNPFRFDAMGFGVLTAYLLVQPRVSALIRLHPTWIYSTAAILFLSELWRYTGPHVGLPIPLSIPSWYHQVGSFTTTGLSASLIVLSFSISRLKLPALLEGPITYLSKTSYSLYLWHLMVFGYIINELKEYKGIELYFLLLVISILVSYLPYLCTELPFIRIRDKLSMAKPKAHPVDFSRETSLSVRP